MPAASAGPVQKSRKIQIGYCARLNEIDAAKVAGFDYVELRTTEIAALSDEEFEKLTAKLKRIDLPAPVTYLFIPGVIKLTGPNIESSAGNASVFLRVEGEKSQNIRITATDMSRTGRAVEFDKGAKETAVIRQ